MSVAALPQTTAPLYQQPDGSFSATSTGVTGELLVNAPVTDLVCVDDLDPSGNETTSDLQALAQDVYHLLLESPGSNLDDPTRGVGLGLILSRPAPDLLALPGQIDAQLRKDDRIDASKSSVVQNADGSFSLTVQIVVNGALLPLGYVYTSAKGLVQR